MTERRKPDIDQRRRELCDAAVELLAAQGARGLTHLRVDRHLGVADGTTSFYYPTRAGLLRGALDRVIALDAADYTEAFASQGVGQVEPLLAQLAESAMLNAVEPARSRARARFELMMIASRDPELDAVFHDFLTRLVALSQAAVADVQPAGSDPDSDLIHKQAFGVITFLAGFLFQLAYGLIDADEPSTLEGYLRGVVAGIADEHARTHSTVKKAKNESRHP